MPQYKKDEIKKKIHSAARCIFAEKGYENASISDIAAKATVSVGNIYRYYKGKDDIFYAVVPPDFIDWIKSSLVNKITAAKDITLSEVHSHEFLFINEAFIEFMASNREIILIVFMGAKGTRYESLKDDTIDYLIKAVKEHYSSQDNRIINDIKNDFIIRMIYGKLIEMLMNVLKESNNTSDIHNSLYILNSYHLFGATNLFK
jgi:hypothetical protein